MSTDAAPIFDAALALPLAVRADLAAKLIESLDEESPPKAIRTPEEWAEEIKARCDEIDRGEAELIDGDEAIAQLREMAARAELSP